MTTTYTNPATTIRLYDRSDNLLASMPLRRYGIHILAMYLRAIIGGCVPRNSAVEWEKIILGPATDHAIAHASA